MNFRFKIFFILNIFLSSLFASVTINNPKVNGYALDYCKEWGRDCGKPAVDTFCKLHGYFNALDFKVKKDTPPTKIISSGKICRNSNCDRIESVTCNSISGVWQENNSNLSYNITQIRDKFVWSVNSPEHKEIAFGRIIGNRVHAKITTDTLSNKKLGGTVKIDSHGIIKKIIWDNKVVFKQGQDELIHNNTHLLINIPEMDIPYNPETTDNRSWLYNHSGELLDIIKKRVHDEQIINKYKSEENELDIYTIIDNRTKKVDEILAR